MILYFSGTGNSAYVAKNLADILEDSCISISDRIKKRNREKIESEKPLVFVVPTYAWRIPRVVEEWIEKMSFAGNEKVYFVMTCGDSNGNAGKYIQKLCLKKNFEYMGCQKIVMPENYLAMFPVPEEAEAVGIVRKADPLIYRAAEAIRNGQHFDEKKPSAVDRISSGIVNDIFYAFFVKDRKFYATDDCISCGKCVDACLLHNITMNDGKPEWNKKCTHCMACICDCPKEAIEYGKASKGRPRYHCPV